MNRETQTVKTRLWRWGLAALLFSAGLLVFSGNAGFAPSSVSAQDSPETDAEETRQPPMVSPALLERFKKAVKDSPVYREADMMRADKLEQHIPGWSQELGFAIVPERINFLERLLDWGGYESPEGEFNIEIEDVNDYDEYKPRDYQIFLSFYGSDGRELSGIVKPKQLAEFRFEYFEVLRLQHPLNRVLPTWVSDVSSIADISSKLCELAGVEHVIQNTTTEPRATLLLKNRSIMDCLKMVLASAGWHLQVQGESRNRGVDAGEIFETYEERFYNNVLRPERPKIETQLDAARAALASQADYMKYRRPVLIISEKGPKPKNPEKK